MVRVERVEPSQWEIFKDVRCRALAEAPYAFSSTLEGALRKSDEEWRAQVQESAESTTKALFLAYLGEDVCGVMGCLIEGEDGENADLFSVWVAPEYRRHGVAGAMLDAAKTWARNQGGRVLLAWVAEENVGALRFYRAAGMADSGRSEPMREGAEERQILLVAGLS